MLCVTLTMEIQDFNLFLLFVSPSTRRLSLMGLCIGALGNILQGVHGMQLSYAALGGPGRRSREYGIRAVYLCFPSDAAALIETEQMLAGEPRLFPSTGKLTTAH
jgi:hypothetical protein